MNWLTWFRRTPPPPPPDICRCGHPKQEHRFIGQLQPCEHGLDSDRDECCDCWAYQPTAEPPPGKIIGHIEIPIRWRQP